MNIHIYQSPATSPDWDDIARRRPIEDLLNAPSAEVCFGCVLEAVDCDASVEVLIEALDEVTPDDHCLHMRSSVEALVLDADLRAALWLALALRGIPGAASEVSSAYAALAFDMSMTVIARQFGARTQEQVGILESLARRITDARIAAIGWAVVAAGKADPKPGVPLTLTAVALGGCIEEVR